MARAAAAGSGQGVPAGAPLIPPSERHASFPDYARNKPAHTLPLPLHRAARAPPAGPDRGPADELATGGAPINAPPPARESSPPSPLAAPLVAGPHTHSPITAVPRDAPPPDHGPRTPFILPRRRRRGARSYHHARPDSWVALLAAWPWSGPPRARARRRRDPRRARARRGASASALPARSPRIKRATTLLPSTPFRPYSVLPPCYQPRSASGGNR